MTLISKKNNPQGLEEFRLISLIKRLYKVISKVLTNRLRKVLDKVIDFRQSAFLGGRYIWGGFFMANEVMDDAKRRKNKCIVIEVEFEKAYNSI